MELIINGKPTKLFVLENGHSCVCVKKQDSWICKSMKYTDVLSMINEQRDKIEDDDWEIKLSKFISDSIK